MSPAASGGPRPVRRTRRDLERVTIVSPHYDDAPLSLGQSMLDGWLAGCRLTVAVVFSRTNWTRWVHPSRGRARAVTLWRRAEEAAAARVFGYRVRAFGFEEMILRTGETDPEVLLGAGEEEVASDPLVGALTDRLRPLRGSSDVVLFPVGMGNHCDHRLVTEAGLALAAQHTDGIAFYEDRPYVSLLTEAERDRHVAWLAARVAECGSALRPLDVSGPVTERLHRLLRRCYPSQIEGPFLDAMAADISASAGERLWVPSSEAEPSTPLL